MKVGSIVRLSRPWESGQKYKNAIGIVEDIEKTNIGEGDSCRVRIEDPDYRCVHYSFTCFKYRFDILKE